MYAVLDGSQVMHKFYLVRKNKSCYSVSDICNLFYCIVNEPECFIFIANILYFVRNRFYGLYGLQPIVFEFVSWISRLRVKCLP